MRRLEGLLKLIASFTHPLVIVGVLVLVFFGIHDHLIDSEILPPLPEKDVTSVIYRLLDYGFIIGLVVVVLGFALSFYKLHHGTTSAHQPLNRLPS